MLRWLLLRGVVHRHRHVLVRRDQHLLMLVRRNQHLLLLVRRDQHLLLLLLMHMRGRGGNVQLLWLVWRQQLLHQRRLLPRKPHGLQRVKRPKGEAMRRPCRPRLLAARKVVLQQHRYHVHRRWRRGLHLPLLQACHPLVSWWRVRRQRGWAALPLIVAGRSGRGGRLLFCGRRGVCTQGW